MAKLTKKKVQKMLDAQRIDMEKDAQQAWLAWTQTATQYTERFFNLGKQIDALTSKVEELSKTRNN